MAKNISLDVLLKNAIIIPFFDNFQQILIPAKGLLEYFDLETDDDLMEILATKEGLPIKDFFRSQGFRIRSRAFNFTPHSRKVSDNAFILAEVSQSKRVKGQIKIIVPDAKYVRMLVY